MSSDVDNLQRYVDAQSSVFARVWAELAAGRKTSHWMWFVFPQLAGLGQSAMSRHYALATLDEASTYLAHPLLGSRLRECTALVLGLEGVSAEQLFGHPDDLKFQSCMTLFTRAAPREPLFHRALDRYAGGMPDGATLRLLDRDAPSPAADLKAGVGSHQGGGLTDMKRTAHDVR